MEADIILVYGLRQLRVDSCPMPEHCAQALTLDQALRLLAANTGPKRGTVAGRQVALQRLTGIGRSRLGAAESAGYPRPL
jgi:hypothetical protein